MEKKEEIKKEEMKDEEMNDKKSYLTDEELMKLRKFCIEQAVQQSTYKGSSTMTFARMIERYVLFGEI
jgi:hypothetical protein